MSGDELLRKLGELARQQGRAEPETLDERWDALSAGEVLDQEHEQLQKTVDDPERAALAYEAFRPLGAEICDQNLDRVKSEFGRPAATASKVAKQATQSLRWWRRFRFWFPIAVAVPAAVALAVLVRPLSSVDESIPGYTLTASRGIHEQRGERPPGAGGIPRFGIGTLLEVYLRPARAVSGPVVASVFAQKGQQLEPLSLRVTTDPGASMRLRAWVGQDIHLAPGLYTLWTALTRPENVPALDQLQVLISQSAPPVLPTGQLLGAPILILGDEP